MFIHGIVKGNTVLVEDGRLEQYEGERVTVLLPSTSPMETEAARRRKKRLAFLERLDKDPPAPSDFAYNVEESIRELRNERI